MNHFWRKLGSRVLASRLPTKTPIRLAMVKGSDDVPLDRSAW